MPPGMCWGSPCSQALIPGLCAASGQGGCGFGVEAHSCWLFPSSSSWAQLSLSPCFPWLRGSPFASQDSLPAAGRRDVVPRLELFGQQYFCFWEADGLRGLSQLLDANVFLPSSEARGAESPNTPAGAAWPALLAGLQPFLLSHKATALFLLPSLSPHPPLPLLVSTARTFKGFQV